MELKTAKRLCAMLCVLALIATTLPLYAIAFFNHPYYDDYGFSAGVRAAWQETGEMGAVLAAAWESARETRATWQGTYLGTLLSNLQPGLFDESLYWIGNFVLLTAFIACFWAFFTTVFKVLDVEKWARVTLASLAIILMIQFMPDVGEAFYWFNGGIGNSFVYALLALAAALLVKWFAGSKAAYVGLVALAVALGGGSYGGGLFALCLSALGLVWLFARKHEKRFWALGLAAVFALCFAYSMTAPGNAVRASVIQYHTSPVKAVAKSLFYGAALCGSYGKLPIIAITVLLLPALYRAARESRFAFKHPVWVGLIGLCVYCTQFTPPLYSIASIGAGRIENTYFISFVALWFLYAYYLAGFAARKLPELPAMTSRRFGALALAALCVFGTGCLAWKRPGDVLYGAQNLSGPSAALSILTGEAAQYDREMDERERLLNGGEAVVTLKPLTACPAVFMDDLIIPNATYDVRPALCLYYGKEAIRIEGEVDAP